MNTPHAMQIKAQADKADRAKQDALERAQYDEFIAITGAKVLHLQPITVAYVEDRRDVLMISTAVCAPGDAYNKKIGRNLALDRLRDDRFITLRCPRGMSKTDFLKAIFGTAAMMSQLDINAVGGGLLN